MIDIWSVATVSITPYAHACPLAQATGFFVQSRRSYTYLVTNYHVASGRHPTTNCAIDADSHVPDRLLLAVYSGNANDVHTWKPLVIPLEVDQRDNWIAHPDYGRSFDVVVIPIPASVRGLVAIPSEPWPPISVLPASDVAIIGFPKGLSGGGGFPIWKTGGIASEPELTVDGEDYFWIDSNTRSGMSGAPVLARRFGGYLDERGGSSITNTHADRLLGIYAGRALDSPDVTLGRVWRLRGLHEILEQADLASCNSRYYLPCSIAHFREPTMATITNSILSNSTDQSGPQATISDVIRIVVDNDQRFGMGIERVRLAAKTIAACEEAKRNQSGVEIDPMCAALVLDALTQPTGWFMPPMFRAIITDLEKLIGELTAIVRPAQ